MSHGVVIRFMKGNLRLRTLVIQAVVTNARPYGVGV